MDSINLAGVERPETVKERVYHALENAILGGLIGQDDVLRESPLAEKLNVSRTPVREALQELSGKGLLESAGGRGKRVRRIRPQEVQELFWLRQVLEGAIVERLALQGLSEQQIAEIEGHLAAQRAAMQSGDRHVFLAADSSFHVALADFVGFPKVKAMIINLRQLFHLVGLKAVKHSSRLEEVLAEHTEIVNAIRQGNPTAARQATSEHLMRTEQLVITEVEFEAKT